MREWTLLVCPACNTASTADDMPDAAARPVWCDGTPEDKHRQKKMLPVLVREVDDAH